MTETSGAEFAELKTTEQFDLKRKKYGHPSKDEISETMSKTHPSFIASLEKECNLNIPLRKEGIISQPRLCSLTLLQIINTRCDREMDGADRNNDKKNFCYYYDFREAAWVVLESIMVAETEIAGDGEKTAREMLDDPSANPDSKDIVYENLRSFYQKSAELLMKDKTGGKLISHMFDVVAGGDAELVDFGMSEKYIFEGATFAKEAYGNFFEKTKPLYPPKPTE